MAVVALASGCAAGVASTDSGGATYHGTVLPSPLPLPDMTLIGPGGAPYPVGPEPAGTVTLMYFGYTRCPDICSVDMATIAGGLRRLPADVQSHVRVLFITTDPARDDPKTLATWLGRFDSSLTTKFIGLTGTEQQIEAAQKEVNLPVSEKSGTLPGGGPSDYAVTHAGVVVAFGTDGLSRLVYLQGTSLSDYVADLPKLVDGAQPETAETGRPADEVVTGTGSVGDVTVVAARARPAHGGLTVTMTLSLITTTEDTLIGVSSSAGAASLVDPSGAVVKSVPIPVDSPTVLTPSGTLLQIAQSAPQQKATGSSIKIALTFQRSGMLLLAVPVVR